MAYCQYIVPAACCLSSLTRPASIHLPMFSLARFHMRAIPSFPPATRKPFSGENRIFRMVEAEPRKAAISFFVSTLQMRTIWSSPAEANEPPSGLKATDHHVLGYGLPVWQAGCRNRGPRGEPCDPSCRTQG